MKITILAPNFSQELGGSLRARMLSKALQREFEVELVGPDLGEGVWTLFVQDKSVPYHSVELEKGFKSFAQLHKLYEEIGGDMLYAQKPVLQTFGLGILKKHFDKVPLILDLDDWEWGQKKAQYSDLYDNRAFFLARTFLGPDAFTTYTNALLQGCLTPYADAITVSSSFLQRKFGGETIYQAVDTSFYDPGKFDRQSIMAKLGIKESEKVVMFAGRPGPHKGVDDLVAAVSRIKDVDVKLVVVGIDNSEYCRRLVHEANRTLGQRFLGLPMQQCQQAPGCLSIANVVAIPQKRSPASVGQMPRKLFDAMAMAKPIVATNVSDLRQTLSDCGWIVEPGDLLQLSRTIENILTRPEEAQEKGKKAREKCIRDFSLDAVGIKLSSIIKNLREIYQIRGE